MMRDRASRTARGDGAWRTYVVASLPAWLSTATVCVLLHTRGDLPLWAAGAIVGVLIATDLALFPRQRRYYTSEVADQRMVGKEGVAVADLAPRGFVRVHGELWQATVVDREHPMREGDTLRVVAVHGLELIVERRGDATPTPLQ